MSDVEGDVKYNINTFAAKYGVSKTASTASALLVSAYIAAIVLPLVLPGSFNKVAMSAGHSVLLSYFVYSAVTFEPTSSSSIRDYYKAIWNLFYLEYCLYPFI